MKAEITPLVKEEVEHMTPVVPSLNGVTNGAPQQELLESLERYKLVARLGHGGMAEVFLAAWEVAPFVHRPVVIKRLHEHFSEDQRLVQMFLDEARLLCLLEHPHVIKTLEAGIIDGRCCIAMEYLEGQPLHVVLRRAYERGGLPLEAAVSIAISVLDGLHYAHEVKDETGQSLEIVHRDVSPQNVFVTNDGQVKVLDFGIAKAKTHEGRTAAGVVKGKIGYIAPEQATGEGVDRRADVWSAGVVLWEALTGERLFKGETDAATLNASLKGDIPNVTTRRPELPLQIEAVLLRALQRSPGLRYQTAAAMQRDLQSWLASTGKTYEDSALAQLMHELFASEVLEQRRMVSALMARSDCTAPAVGAISIAAGPSSTRIPTSTSALIVDSNPHNDGESGDLDSKVNGRPGRRRRGRSSVAVFAALLLSVGGIVFYLMVFRLDSRGPSAAEAKSESARASGDAQPTSANPGAAVASRVPWRTSDPVSPSSGERPALAPSAVPSTGRSPAPSKPLAIPSPAQKASPALRMPARTSARALEPAAASAALAKPDPTQFGFLTLDTSPWSLVSVGGKALGQTPLMGVKLPPGPQVLVLRNPELGIQTSYTVTIEAGKNVVRRIGIE